MDKKIQVLRLVFIGGADCPKDELDGRVINLGLSMDCGTNWVRQPAAGGDGRDRTDDLLNAIQALSQLSYAPKYIIILSYLTGFFNAFVLWDISNNYRLDLL